MSTNFKKTFLLVSFETPDEDLKQEVLELAYEYGIIPYSSDSDEDDLVLDSPSSSISSRFIERIRHNDLDVKISTFSR